MKDIHDLFEEDTAGFHDAVVEATNMSLSNDKLKKLFKALPKNVQNMAYTYGFMDTVFGDRVVEFLKTNKLQDLI